LGACPIERTYAVESLSQYWPKGEDLIHQLPSPHLLPHCRAKNPPALARIRLPAWAHDIGIEGNLLIPAQLIRISDDPIPNWHGVDWLGAIFWYLAGSAEREFEKEKGPIHSYANRLKGWSPELWQYAWVNRIALFLRRWAARRIGRDENALFGSLPEAKIFLTHDLDATNKTPILRAKQTCFRLINSMGIFLKGHFGAGLNRLKDAIRFFVSTGDYWCFDLISELEKQMGCCSYYFVYAGLEHPRKLSHRIFDPSYDISQSKLKKKLRELLASGNCIGLHPSFEAWADPEIIRKQRERLEFTIDHSVSTCRQHWLRFGWEHTWKAQEQAGLSLDFTLGFNDRCGFRNGAAIVFHPWHPEFKGPHRLEAIPLVLMDSHLCSSELICSSDRVYIVNKLLNEVKSVGGTCSILWHPHVFSNDFGWRNSYCHALNQITSRGKAESDLIGHNSIKTN
jgi:hypothetical protein